MTYIVKLINRGQVWFLRGTTWTGDADRAAVFANEQAAAMALVKAQPFMKPGLFKRATVEVK